MHASSLLLLVYIQTSLSVTEHSSYWKDFYSKPHRQKTARFENNSELSIPLDQKTAGNEDKDELSVPHRQKTARSDNNGELSIFLDQKTAGYENNDVLSKPKQHASDDNLQKFNATGTESKFMISDEIDAIIYGNYSYSNGYLMNHDVVKKTPTETRRKINGLINRLQNILKRTGPREEQTIKARQNNKTQNDFKLVELHPSHKSPLLTLKKIENFLKGKQLSVPEPSNSTLLQDRPARRGTRKFRTPPPLDIKSNLKRPPKKYTTERNISTLKTPSQEMVEKRIIASTPKPPVQKILKKQRVKSKFKRPRYSRKHSSNNFTNAHKTNSYRKIAPSSTPKNVKPINIDALLGLPPPINPHNPNQFYTPPSLRKFNDNNPYSESIPRSSRSHKPILGRQLIRNPNIVPIPFPPKDVPSYSRIPGPSNNAPNYRRPFPGSSLPKNLGRPNPGPFPPKNVRHPILGPSLSKNVRRPFPGPSIPKNVRRPIPGPPPPNNVRRPFPGPPLSKNIRRPVPSKDTNIYRHHTESKQLSAGKALRQMGQSHYFDDSNKEKRKHYDNMYPRFRGLRRGRFLMDRNVGGRKGSRNRHGKSTSSLSRKSRKHDNRRSRKAKLRRKKLSRLERLKNNPKLHFQINQKLY